jgi:diguanylate cyclase (GGDEF)-like protein
MGRRIHQPAQGWQRIRGSRGDCPLRQQDGKISHYVAIKDDMTDKKAAIEAIRQSELKFHTMMDWASDWVYWIKPDGQFHYMTPSAEKSVATGRPNSSAIRRCWMPSSTRKTARNGWPASTIAATATGRCKPLAWICASAARTAQSAGSTHLPPHPWRGRQLSGPASTLHDITERKQAEDEIRQLAHYDPLTWLPNRRLLFDRLEQAQKISERTREHGVLMMLDLDQFKKLNDTLGHEMGDKLLVQVGRRLRDTMREADTVARLGGDEFVSSSKTWASEPAAKRAEQIAENIRDQLSRPTAWRVIRIPSTSTPPASA